MADEKRFELNETTLKQLQEMWDFFRALKRMRGDGLKVSPFGVSFEIPTGRRPGVPHPSTPSVLVKITGDASGGGKYNGKILTPPTSAFTATGTLAESEIGVVPTADNALVFNLQEVGKNTHDIDTAGGFVPLVFIGIVIGATTAGLRVVVIDGSQWEDCS